MTSPYREAAPELGALLATHQERSGCVLRVLFGGMVLVLLVFAISSGIPGSIAIAMALVIGLGAGSLWMIGRRNPQGRIDRFERGIVSHARNESRTIKFDDIKCITSVTTQRRRTGLEQQLHIVEANDGTKIDFTLIYDNAIDLRAAIDDATRERLLAEALVRYDAGDVVKFGPIAISEDGFFEGAHPVVAWSEIDRAAIEMPQIGARITSSEIKIWKKGDRDPFLRCSTERVPNAALLVELVSLAIQVEADATSE